MKKFLSLLILSLLIGPFAFAQSSDTDSDFDFDFEDLFITEEDAQAPQAETFDAETEEIILEEAPMEYQPTLREQGYIMHGDKLLYSPNPFVPMGAGMTSTMYNDSSVQQQLQALQLKVNATPAAPGENRALWVKQNTNTTEEFTEDSYTLTEEPSSNAKSASAQMLPSTGASATVWYVLAAISLMAGGVVLSVRRSNA